MNFKLKRIFTFLLALAMLVTSIPASTMAARSPRMAVKTTMTTNATSTGEINPNDMLTATVTWNSILSPSGDPITIRTTNGAKIMINNPADVTFKADGTASPVGAITSNATDSEVSFQSGPVVSSPLTNQITFNVKPPANGDFNLSVMIGMTSTTEQADINFVEKTFTVANLFTIETSDETIVGNMPFEIFGETGYTNSTNFMVGISVNNKDSNTEFIQNSKYIETDGSYKINNLMFPATAPTGTYVVTAMLLDQSLATIGTIEKEIEYIASSLILDPVSDLISGDKPVAVSGQASFTDVAMVSGVIVDKSTDTPIHNFPVITNIAADGTFDLGEYTFSNSAAVGTYILKVTALDSAGVPLATTTKEFRYVKSINEPGNINIARDTLGTVMTSSTPANKNRQAKLANDGIRTIPPLYTGTSPSWIAVDTGASWIMADFGKLMEFDRVTIFENGGRARNYVLEYSTDGTNFTELDSGLIMSKNGIYNYVHPEKVVGQYVRMKIAGSSNLTAVSLFEFEVYNMPAADEAILIAPEDNNKNIDLGWNASGEQLYYIQPTKRTRVLIDLLNHNDKYDLTLYNAKGVDVTPVTKTITDGSRYDFIISSGKHFIKVSPKTSSAVSPNLSMSVNVIQGIDIAERNDDFSTATVTPVKDARAYMYGNIDNVDDKDFYKVDVTSSGEYLLDLNSIPTGSTYAVTVYRADQQVVTTFDVTKYEDSKCNLTAGTYYLSVHSKVGSGTALNYSFIMEKVMPANVAKVTFSGEGIGSNWIGPDGLYPTIRRLGYKYFTVSGIATDSYGNPMANKQIVFGAFNPKWASWTGDDDEFSRKESKVITTDSNGYFSISFSISGICSYSYDGDLGYVYIRPAESSKMIFQKWFYFTA
jgi:hypothetical protein